MDFQLLDDAGVVLSTRERSCLRAALPLLQKRNKLANISFWGKVSGVQADYFVAQGQDDVLGEAKSFFSLDCVNWAQLPRVDAEAMEKCIKMQELFTGNPNFEYAIQEADPNAPPEPPKEEEEQPAEGEEKPKPTGKVYSFTEDKRLAVFVKQCDYFTAIVPRGYLVMGSMHRVSVNRMFSGLEEADAVQLHSFMHQRPPETVARRSIAEQLGLSKSLDFLDTIDTDVPVGGWSLQYDAGMRLVLLRSLLWPGFVLFLRPGTPHWGRAYVGTGLQNVDVAFMLPSVPFEVSAKALLTSVVAFNEAAAQEELRKDAAAREAAAAAAEPAAAEPAA